MYSQNERAKELLGCRPDGIPLDQPSELGYKCPIGKQHHIEWSEYQGFIWCKIDNLDIPSCFCIGGISCGDINELKKAINLFLDIIEGMIRR